jgi:hypothetical protein
VSRRVAAGDVMPGDPRLMAIAHFAPSNQRTVVRPSCPCSASSTFTFA